MRMAMKTTFLVVALLCSGMALAQLSVNVGATSDYIWRGITQNEEDPSFSAGVEWTGSNGFYLKSWAANVADPGEIEIDGWGGWAGETESGFTWDLGYIYYSFTGESDLNLGEIYASLGYKVFSVKYSDDSENDTSYLEANLEFELPGDYRLGLHGGDYDLSPDVSTNDVMVSVSKDWNQFTFMAAYSRLEIDVGSFSHDDDTFFGGITWSWTRGQ